MKVSNNRNIIATTILKPTDLFNRKHANTKQMVNIMQSCIKESVVLSCKYPNSAIVTIVIIANVFLLVMREFLPNVYVTNKMASLLMLNRENLYLSWENPVPVKVHFLIVLV